MCAVSAHIGPLKIVRCSESFIPSLNAQMKKSVAPDTVRLRPSAKLSRKRLVSECKYDQNV